MQSFNCSMRNVALRHLQCDCLLQLVAHEPQALRLRDRDGQGLWVASRHRLDQRILRGQFGLETLDDGLGLEDKVALEGGREGGRCIRRV